MNLEEAKVKLKETYQKFFGGETPVAAKFAEMKTKDGNIIMVDGDSAAVGVAVMIADETGQTMPAPDGDITLEDGTIISVKDGMITEVKPAAMEEETEETKLSKLEAQIAKLEISKKIATLKDEIDALKAEKAALSEQTKKATEALEKQEAFTKELFAIVEKLADMPSAESKQVKKDGFAKTGEIKTLRDIRLAVEDFKKSTKEFYKNN